MFTLFFPMPNNIKENTSLKQKTRECKKRTYFFVQNHIKNETQVHNIKRNKMNRTYVGFLWDAYIINEKLLIRRTSSLLFRYYVDRGSNNMKIKPPKYQFRRIQINRSRHVAVVHVSGLKLTNATFSNNVPNFTPTKYCRRRDSCILLFGFLNLRS